VPTQLAWPVILLLGLLQQAPAHSSEGDNFRISGTAVDALSALPLHGARVSVTSMNASGRTASVLAQADGRFVFEHLGPGKYVLSARCRGYEEQMFQQHENFRTAVVVGNNLGSENLVLRLIRSASLAGQVTDEFSDGVRGAQVMLFREGIKNGKGSIHMERRGATDDEGHYRFAGLQPGRYYVAVAAQPWYAQHNTPRAAQEGGNAASGVVASSPQPIGEQNTGFDVVYPVTYFPSEDDPARASAISLQPGERATADFTLRPVPALHLRLAAPGTDLSQPAGIRVAQPTFDGQEVFVRPRVASKSREYIELAGIPPGHIIINVDVYMGVVNGKPRYSWRKEVDASRRAELNLNLTEAGGGGVVSGVVKAAGTASLPQPAAIAIHESESGATLLATVSRDGKFEFRNAGLKSGKYSVSLRNSSGFYVKSVQVDGASVSSHSFEVRGAEPLRLVVEVAQGSGRVEGLALRDGKPVPGAMILLVPNDSQNDPSLYQRDQSDSDGSFTMSQLPPGRYTIMAIENGWAQEWTNPSVLKRWLSGGDTLQAAPNGKYTITVKVQ
jgi:Carboxypeptidase regulatory-like domain